MAITDPIRQQILYDIEVRGQNAITELEAEQAKLARGFDIWKRLLQSGAVDGATFREMTQGMANDLRTTTQSIDYAAKSILDLDKAQKALNASMSQAAIGTNRLQYGMIELGRAFEDFSVAGPLGALNNLNRFVEVLGGPAGLTVAFTVASSAAYVLYRNWSSVMDTFGLSGTKTEAEHMEELGKKTHKTAEEQKQYNEYKREQGQIEELIRGKSQEDARMEQVFKAAVDEAGGLGKISKGLIEARGGRTTPMPEGMAQLRDQLAFIAEAIDDMSKITDPAHRPAAQANIRGLLIEQERAQARMAPMEAAFNKAQLDQANEDLRKAMVDPAHRRGLIAEMAGAPGAFPRGFADNIQDAQLEADQQFQKVDDDNARAKTARLQKKAEDKHRKESEKLIDAEIIRSMGFDARSVREDEAEKKREAHEAAQEAKRAAAEENRKQLEESRTFSDLQKTALRNQERARKAFPKQLRAAQQQAVAEEIQGRTGADDRTSMAVAHQALQKFDRGLNINLAMQEAWREALARLNAAEMKLNQLDAGLRRGNFQRRTRRGTFTPF